MALLTRHMHARLEGLHLASYSGPPPQWVKDWLRISVENAWDHPEKFTSRKQLMAYIEALEYAFKLFHAEAQR